jgi:hypothetical protein
VFSGRLVHEPSGPHLPSDGSTLVQRGEPASYFNQEAEVEVHAKLLICKGEVGLP